MRFILGAGLVGGLVLAALALTACGGAMQQASGSSARGRSVIVVGRGEATGKPDIARASVGIEAQSPDVAEAVREANDRATQIIAAAKALGIEEKDLRTTSFFIYVEHPQVPIAPARVAVKGATPQAEAAPAAIYHAGNSVEVVIRDLAKVSDVLGATIHAGANTVSGLSFEIADTRALEAEARQKAVANARDDAEALARHAGVALGPVVSISEIIGATAGSLVANREFAAASGPPIQPGELTVHRQIEIVYSLSPSARAEP